MSVIAVKVEADKITIAADSIIIKDDLKRTNFQKLRNLGQIIVGGCGSAEELSLFFEFTKRSKDKLTSVYAVQEFMNKFATCKRAYTDDNKINNAYIIIYDKHVYEVDGMFVQEVKDYTAIGEGEPYALTALYLGHDVVEAVQAACKFSCFVSEPIVSFEVDIWKQLK